MQNNAEQSAQLRSKKTSAMSLRKRRKKLDLLPIVTQGARCPRPCVTWEARSYSSWLSAFCAPGFPLRHPAAKPNFSANLPPRHRSVAPISTDLGGRLQVESLNSQLRKALKNRGPFPNDDAVFKVFFLAIRNAKMHWKADRNWCRIIAQLEIFFEGRLPV